MREDYRFKMQGCLSSFTAEEWRMFDGQERDYLEDIPVLIPDVSKSPEVDFLKLLEENYQAS